MIWLNTVPENAQRERLSAATIVLEIADNGVTIWTTTNLQRTVRNMWRKVIMIKIFAGIGMGWVLFVAYVLLKCSLERFKRWRKTGCKVKMLCKPHVYGFYYMWPNDGELTLKCKKCGKVKKLYVDVESFKGVFDKV